MPDFLFYPAAQPVEQPRFSIFLPTWNNLPYLELCIRSIREHSDFVHQIIVFVNEGGDGTLEWLKLQKEIDYLHAAENVGICYAVNACREKARAEYFLYLNDDMYVCPKWDYYLWEQIAKIPSPNFFLSGTMIEPLDTGNDCVIVQDFGRDIASFEEEKLLESYLRIAKKDWNGATWSPNVVHKSMWDAVGGYSLEFSPGMYSDPDFSRKLWELGVRHFQGIGKSRVYHFGTKSTGRVKKNDGRKTFAQKWGVTANTFFQKFLQRGSDFQGILPEYSPSLVEKMKAWWKGR